ncbi:TetR/AcrR family transcriptional regulator [Actinoplanes sp. NPDC051513]|uniref:TetR/AcrR family transcriptional regulator n=1 Tax=Actinoplanes sp. NPDC051513 TaxID=3363908 RepID=UPI0037A52AB3
MNAPPRLRQQRKEETRARIAAAAMDLFAERGFERVSVVEVAAAAGVTEKTVFNHFATKEDLVYSGDQAFEAALLAAVRSRASGATVLAAVRMFLLDTYARGTQPRATALAALLASSAALRVREREILARYADRLRDQIAADIDARPGDLRPDVAAQSLIAVHQAVIAGYREGLLAGEPAAELDERMRSAAKEAFDLLADGLAAWP